MQMFISLLILQHQSNVRCLLHWCLILSTAMYSWGTRDTLGRATSFLGTMVSCSYRDCFYTSLTSNIINTAIWLLSREISGLMVLDNFQCGNQLRDQCGGRSCKFLIGTKEAAHWVFPFFNFTRDHWKTELTYSQDQIIPLSLGMQSYKPVDLMSPSLGMILFTNHEFIPISPEPCFIGKHVGIYETVTHLRRFILSIRRCIIHDYPDDVHNQPAIILCFQEYARQPTAMEFFNDVAYFQRRAVKRLECTLLWGY